MILPVFAALLLAGGATTGFVIWHRHQSRNPLDGLGPGMYQPPASSPGETLALPKH